MKFYTLVPDIKFMDISVLVLSTCGIVQIFRMMDYSDTLLPTLQLTL